jgi:hypothetical protein
VPGDLLRLGLFALFAQGWVTALLTAGSADA